MLSAAKVAVDAFDLERVGAESSILIAEISFTVGTRDSEGIDDKGVRFGFVALVVRREDLDARGTISRSSSEAYDVRAASTAFLNAKGLEVRGKSTLL